MMEPQGRDGVGLLESFFELEARHHVSYYADLAEKSLPIAYSSALLYLATIALLTRQMESRRAMDLKHLLAFWNLLLALFSIVAFLRMTPNILGEFQGIHAAICERKSLDPMNITLFWVYVFMLSKIAEFGDTLFIILRKKPLTFLHCYHHATVEVYVWISLADSIPAGPWFAYINVFVHSIMYSYYFLRAIDVSFPVFVAKSITRLQLLQMVAGMFISTYAFIVQLFGGYSCDHTYWHCLLSFLLYFGYFVLFGQFYVKAYRRKPASSKNGFVSNKIE